MKLKLLEEVAALFYATPNLRHRREREDTHRKKARHVCQWVAFDAGYTKSDIARFWGMDRGAIYYGCKMVNNRIDTDPAEKEELMDFMKVVAKYIKEHGH